MQSASAWRIELRRCYSSTGNILDIEENVAPPFFKDEFVGKNGYSIGNACLPAGRNADAAIDESCLTLNILGSYYPTQAGTSLIIPL
jgi:hypothetical protein